MTDAELLALIEECDPADLTSDEIARLRAAAETSPQVARAVRERVALDERLFHSLGQPSLPVERILARAHAGASRRGWPWLLAIAVLVLFAGGVVAWLPRATVREAAVREDEAPPRTTEPEAADPLRQQPAPEPPLPAEPAPVEARVEPRPVVDDPAGTGSQPPATTAPAPRSDRDPWAIDPELAALADRSPEELLLQLTDPARPPLSAADVAKWLEPVPDAPGGKPRGDLSDGRLAGLYRLRPPLTAGTCLRITIDDFRRLRILAWSGTSGAMVASYQWLNPDLAPWAGFTTTRTNASPLPTGLVLAARDDGRGCRVGSASPVTIDLRHENGLLTLSHGDLRWLDVPMVARPTEVYLELALSRPRRLEMIPAVKLTPLPVADTDRAELPLGDLAGDDGGATLTAEGKKQPAWPMLRLPPASGPREVIVRVDSWDVGTGIAVGDGDGKPTQLFIVRSTQHDKTQRVLWAAAVGDNRLEADARPEKNLYAFTGSATWLKFLQRGGRLDVFMSGDGIRWTHMHEGPASTPGAIASIGPCAVAHDSRRSITIGSVQLGSFPRLAAAAPPEALREIADGCGRERVIEILEDIWRRSLTAGLETDAALALLDEIATLAPVWESAADAIRVRDWYADIGRRLGKDEDPRPYTSIAWRQQAAPLLCWHRHWFFPDALARSEACGHLVFGRWDELNALGRRVVVFDLTGTQRPLPFYDWASRVRGGPRIDAWRHPLDVAVGKDAERVVDDMKAAIADDDVVRGCELIVAAGAEGDRGLVADWSDPDLAVSLTTFIDTLMRDEPRIRDTMRKAFTDRATLRLRQAIDTADAGLLEAVALQYPGTAPAAEAHLSLGDRRLAAGEWGLARWHYRAAREADAEIGVARREAANAIATAAEGTATLPSQGGNAADRVAIGAASLPAAGWRELATEIVAAREASRPFNRFGMPTTSVTALPPEGAYELIPRARMEGDVGAGHGQVPAEYTVSAGPPADVVDWVARQMGVTVAGPRLIVSNRFHVSAHDAATGAVQWRTGLGGEVGLAHAQPGQPMRPVVGRDHVYVRRLTKNGAVLAALQSSDGKLAWQTKPAREGWAVVSDPVLGDGSLRAVTASPGIGGQSFAVAVFSSMTGDILDERELFTIRAAANELETSCQLWPMDESFIVVAAGSVACLDPMGGVRWVRREPWIPPAADPSWRMQAQEPPLRVGDALVVVQPAVPAVVAIDAASGRVRWKRAVTGVRRSLGITMAGDRRLVVLAAATSLLALDAATGKTDWQTDLPNLLDGCLASPAGVLVTVHEAVPNTKESIPVLVWLDGDTGAGGHRAPLDALKSQLPRLGPFVEAGGKFWAFSGAGPAEATRTIGELTAKTSPPAAGP